MKKRFRSRSPQKELVLDDDITPYRIVYVVLILALLFIDILFQRKVEIPFIQRSWGLNNFSYSPIWAQVVTFLFLFSSTIPFVNHRLQYQFSKLTFNAVSEKSRFRKIILAIGISVLFSSMLYLFRVKYDLLGDMNLRVTQSVNKQYVADEYFTMYVLHYLNIVLLKLFHFTAHNTFVFHSVLGGFFYSLFAFLTADLLFERKANSIAFYLFSICIGTILVFCGYVEIYAFPVASVALYIYSAVLFLKKKVNIIFPIGCFIFALVLHLEQVSLFPSLIFLIIRKYKFSKYIDTRVILGLALISIPAIYSINAIHELSPLTRLTPDKNFPGLYTLFSFSHLWEFFNAEFISGVVLLFLFPIVLWKMATKKINTDDLSKFFLITTIFSFVIVFTALKERGSGDWDICSFPAVTLSMFIAYVFLSQGIRIYSKRKMFYILSVALFTNLLGTCAWVGLNHSSKSVDKIIDMLVTDPGYYYVVYVPAEIGLEINFLSNGLKDKAFKQAEVGYRKYGNRIPFASFNYASYLISESKDTTKAIEVMKGMTNKFPFYKNNFNELCFLYEKRHMVDAEYDLLVNLSNLYALHPKDVLQYSGRDFLMRAFNFLSVYSIVRKDTTVHKTSLVLLEELHNQ